MNSTATLATASYNKQFIKETRESKRKMAAQTIVSKTSIPSDLNRVVGATEPKTEGNLREMKSNSNQPYQ